MSNFFKISALALAVTSFFSVAEADTLRVGTHPSFAPFEFSDTSGNVTGFDLDLIKAIAAANGDSVEIASMPFDGLIPSLLTSNLDAIISGMTITAERAKRVDFTDGYYNSTLSILLPKNVAAKMTTAEDLKGQTICVQLGTTGHQYANVISPGNVKALNNESDAIMEMSNGGCSAVINDRPVNLYYLQKSGLKDIVDFVDPSFTEATDSFGIAVRKGNTELLNKLNNGYKLIQQNGKLDELYMKWFGVPASGAKK